MEGEENFKEKRSFRFLFGYVRKYRKCFGQIILGLITLRFSDIVLEHCLGVQSLWVTKR